MQQLEQMSESGPADEFARNLMKGNFGKAAEELARLREKLAAGQMNEQEKQQLMNQMDRMKEQLEKLANQEQLRKQLEKSGLSKQEIDKQLARQATRRSRTSRSSSNWPTSSARPGRP